MCLQTETQMTSTWSIFPEVACVKLHVNVCGNPGQMSAFTEGQSQPKTHEDMHMRSNFKCP